MGIKSRHEPHLVEVGHRRALPSTLVVRHVHKLEVQRKARVGAQERGALGHAGQVAELVVAPVVQLGQARPGSALA